MAEVERLKAEWEAAKAAMCAAGLALEDATAKVHEARSAYRAAVLATTGLSGHLVEYEKRTWRKSETLRFVVDRVTGWDDDNLAGRLLKKDGSLGTREVQAPREKVKDLGLFAKAEIA